ncbi:MAG: pectate lyase [Asticcacaulis sp.]
MEAEGPRIVVFEVGGVIDLQTRTLSIKNPYITIAGQTAPSPGITLIRGETNTLDTHNVIIQHIMFRPGEAGHAKKAGPDYDSFCATRSHNVIVDHCSLSWGSDENLSASGTRFAGETPAEWRRGTSHKITYSNNLIYECLSHSIHPKGEHSKGSLFHDNVTGLLLYGNLYASNYERNALFKGGVHAAQVNNFIYNPGKRAIHYNLIDHEWQGRAFQSGRLAIVGNVYRAGPDTASGLPLFLLGGNGDVLVHIRDNIAVDMFGKPLPLTGRYTQSSARMLADKRPYLPGDIRIIPAARIENEIYRTAGARPWDRDLIDLKLLSDVAEGRGLIIDAETENSSGYPKYAPTYKAFQEADWDLGTMAPKAGWASLFKDLRSKLR